MKVAHLSLILIVAGVPSLLLANYPGSRTAQPNSLVATLVGPYLGSEDSTVQFARSGDDLTVDDALVAGGSSDARCPSFDDDYLSINNQEFEVGHSPDSVSPDEGRWLRDGLSCIVKVDLGEVLARALNKVRTGHMGSGLWPGLIPIFGVVADRQAERSSTSRPTFKKAKPRITTDTVSFRIDSNLRANLEDEAKKNRTSLNTLVSQILFRYADWGRYAGRLGLIPVSKDLLRDVFKSLDKPELEELGRRFAETSGREHVLYLFQHLSLGTMLQFLDLWSSHFDAYEHRYDGKMHFYTVHPISTSTSPYSSKSSSLP